MSTPTTSSGLISADGAVRASPCLLKSVVITAAAANATLLIYDNASAASGTVLMSLSALANTSEVWHLDEGIVANNGLYADIGGAGATAVVLYSPSQ